MHKSQTAFAFDYGQQSVGVALACASESPQPLTTIANSANIIDEISALINQYKPAVLVVGWPRNLDGDKTKQTMLSEKFADQLKVFQLPVELQDEAVTSELAKERLPKKLSSKEAKNLIHQYAAVIILEDWLR